jgi:hypothetical protein
MDFPDSCTISPKTENNGFVDTYGTAVTVKCNLKGLSEMNKEGSNIVNSGWIGFPKSTTVTHSSLVTANSISYPVTLIQEVKRESDHRVEYIRAIIGSPILRSEL